MTFTATEISGWITALLWPLLRVSGMVLVAPVFGANVVPLRVRVVLMLALTVLVAPLAPPPPALAPLSAAGVLALGQQLLIGIALGFAVQVCLDALIMAGQIIAMTMGLGFATLVDPGRGESTPVLSQLLLVLGLLLYLALDGHLALIAVLADGWRLAPVGGSGFGAAEAWTLVLWAGRIFEAGLVVALPAVIALLVVNLGMGIVSRAAPQLNLFAVGFPVAMLAGFVLLLLSLPALRTTFATLLADALEVAAQLGGAAGR